jgi:tol-pal system protein YbgF
MSLRRLYQRLPRLSLGAPSLVLPRKPLLLLLLLACQGLQHASAGVFDDEEARRQINNLTLKTNERLDTSAKAQFELANQIQALREESARLRGQVETLAYELESAKKRQQDFYIDLDGRLRKIEASPQISEVKPSDDGKTIAPKAPVSDPAAEGRDYEAALNLFKANKLKESATAFESFTKTYPESTLTPSAQYWLGNAYYALHDCKKSMDAQKLLLSKWPSHAKASDALINISTCQQELGDAKAAKTTLEAVLIKYPDSPAAALAKQRLKKK